MLEGKVAIVTGGAGGIGRATADCLAASGARVVIFDRAPAGMQLDVTDAPSLRAAIADVAAREGGVDILVNNAGGGAGARLEQLTLDQWNATIALNLTACFVAIGAVAPAMRERGGGAIVNVASIAGKLVSPVGGAAYAAAKAGLLSLTRQAALELAPHRIRVNAVCPGPTRTSLTQNSTRDGARMPLGDWIQPAQVAAAILFFAGAASSGCTGTSLDVDGGLSLTMGGA